MNNTWNIDPTHSSVGFSIRHMAFAKVRGRFTKLSGAIALDEQDLTRSSVDVTIEAASVDTGVGQRDDHLRSPDFFDVAKYPALRFRSTRVEKLEGERFRVIGELTIRDVTHEVALEAEIGGRGKDPWGNQRIGYSATASIDRTEYGLGWNQLLEAGGFLVGDKVEIELDVQAVRAAASVAA